MPFTTILTTDIGKVRQLVTDLDPANPIFPDDQMIQNFIDLEGGSIKSAAALAWETIAGSQALLLKVIQLLDLKQDGKSTAQGLLAVAQQFRDNDDADWAGIDFVEVTDNSQFALREFLYKRLLAQTGGI